MSRPTEYEKKLVDKSQTYFWTRTWQEEEKESDRDIREGKIKEFQSTDELFEELDSH